ncbi:MAG: alpha amylase C-terminal domain-containing protein [Candidatus Merdivicinus sp.]|jgi:1,4-alpha-glucan branching enzyme
MSFSVQEWRNGTAVNAWEYFGNHTVGNQTVFRVWAPGAKEVSVTGPFCGWLAGIHRAEEIYPGIFECRLENVPEYTPYKFVLTSQDGKQIFKSDPFAFHAETPPGNASKCYELGYYEWNDAKWMAKRKAGAQPLSIYQIHAGSFRTYAGGEPLNYRKLGEELAPYLKSLGCTHLGLMPLLEHMQEGDPIRRTTGFLALTSRYGVPMDFCRLVEELHQVDIGVTMDLSLLGFPADDFGLSRFAGDILWEDSDSQEGFYNFHFCKPEVQSFLLSAAHSLLSNFHLDGLRILDAAEIADRPGGLSFLQQFTQNIRRLFPDVILIGNCPNAGFHRITDSDTARTLLDLAAGCPAELSKPKLHSVQQIDLDLVGSISMISRMPGSYDEKFARLRAAIACYRAYPGAKLSFMGNEFAQFTSWTPNRELDWVLMDYEMHRKFLAMVQRTSDFYRKTPAIWEEDPLESRFELIQSAEHPQVKGFIRRDQSGSQIIVLSNFSDKPVEPFVLGVDKRGKYAELFSSDEAQYGGEGRSCHVNFAKLRPADGKPFCIEADLPPFTTVYLYKSAGTTGRSLSHNHKL